MKQKSNGEDEADRRMRQAVARRIRQVIARRMKKTSSSEVGEYQAVARRREYQEEARLKQ